MPVQHPLEMQALSCVTFTFLFKRSTPFSASLIVCYLFSLLQTAVQEAYANRLHLASWLFCTPSLGYFALASQPYIRRMPHASRDMLHPARIGKIIRSHQEAYRWTLLHIGERFFVDMHAAFICSSALELRH
jgi:hypothetical protein